MLYIVPTPIGNLEDITLRALRVLREADLIACEDTRHSRKLLEKYEIKTPVESFHSYSSRAKLEKLLSLLGEDRKLALITDAGMPGISDPGYLLIRGAIERGIPLTVLPGPSAAVTAVVASGFPMHKFTYLGFLPLKKHRKREIEALREEKKTVVFYESPHRLLKTLHELLEALGPERKIAVCRELTKVFEEVFRGTMNAANEYFSKKPPKGEFTLVLAPQLFQET